MKKIDPKNGSIRFSVFEVDLRAGELRKHGVKIKLQEQPFQILQILLERPHETVTREELRKRIWPADTFADFDHGLNNAITRVREALGDSANGPRFIETLARRGYRFIAPVEQAANRPPLARENQPMMEATVALGCRRSSGIRMLEILGTGVALLGVLGGLNPGRLREQLMGEPRSASIQSVAVLPLTNLLADPRQEYFADGMTEMLITDLSQAGASKVISRTSIMRYKKAEKSLAQISRELNVDALVEGAVQRSGERVRVTAQLIHGPTDRHLWSKSYERDMKDVLSSENDLARAIAEQVQAKQTRAEQGPPTASHSVNPQAQDAYLEGRYYLNQSDEKEKRRAIAYFEQALRYDSDYAPAYVGLANAYSERFFRPSEGMPLAEAAATKALMLDETLADGHSALRWLRLTYDWKWPEAEKEFQRAVQLNPNSSDTHRFYGLYLDAMGRLSEGMEEQRRARELDPLSQAIENVGDGFEFAHEI